MNSITGRVVATGQTADGPTITLALEGACDSLKIGDTLSVSRAGHDQPHPPDAIPGESQDHQPTAEQPPRLLCPSCGKEWEKTHGRQKYCAKCRKLTKAKRKKKIQARERKLARQAKKEAPKVSAQPASAPDPVPAPELGAPPAPPEPAEAQDEPSDEATRGLPEEERLQGIMNMAKSMAGHPDDTTLFEIIGQLQSILELTPRKIGAIREACGDDWLVSRCQSVDGLKEVLQMADQTKVSSVDRELVLDLTGETTTLPPRRPEVQLIPTLGGRAKHDITPPDVTIIGGADRVF